MANVGGSAYLRINGISYDTEGEFDIEINSVERSPKTTADGRVHYTEQTTDSRISGNVLAVPGLNPAVLTNAEGVTVMVTLRNGRAALLDGAFSTGRQKLATKDGTVSFEFSGRGRWM